MKNKALQFFIGVAFFCCIVPLVYGAGIKKINTGIKADSLTTVQLLNWNISKDSTVKYYKNIIPLKKAVILSSINRSTIPSVMGEMNYDTYDGANCKVIGSTYPGDRSIFLGWNYLNYYISGTNFNDNQKDHIVSVPTPGEINIGHKNGVKVLGCVDFLWGSGSKNLNTFCENPSLVKEKLLKLAKAFKFDGYFFNIEVDGSSKDVNAILDIMSYLKAKGLHVSWYDAMKDNGKLDYTNSLNKRSIKLFKNSSSFFANYWWLKTPIKHFDISVKTANSVKGRSAADVYLAVQWWSNEKRFDAIKSIYYYNAGNSLKNRLSVALYAAEFPVRGNLTDTASYTTSEFVKMWFANNVYPTANQTPQRMGDYVIPKTTITSLPFKTEFNVGKGNKYFKNGSIVSAKGWGKLSEQNILPYYMLDNKSIAENFDFTTAWNGGSSLKITNKSDKNQIVPVYLTAINTKSYKNIFVKVVYKSKNPGSLILNTNSSPIKIDLSSKVKSLNDGYYEVSGKINSNSKITGINSRCREIENLEC
ncbi:MAG TPA: hypothetical protein QF753_06180 [Victivallales bacterium]|nr:hypothetical protein [Victivallales bacterium]